MMHVVLTGTVEFSGESDTSLNFTAEHTENAEAPENKLSWIFTIIITVMFSQPKELF